MRYRNRGPTREYGLIIAAFLDDGVPLAHPPANRS
jgi:hypothetical protein